MWHYRTRGLERQLPQAEDSVKVVVLEGARAVGKTRLVKYLTDQGRLRSYNDLSQPTARAAAEGDLEGWLRSLPTPAVIDEAQLLPDLPLAVKRIVDERPATLQFVLTGSASIGRSGLGGADPLSGRADRLVLRTFTEMERRGLKRDDVSVVDLLFDGAPRAGRLGNGVDEAILLERIERGGLPEFAIGPGDRQRRAARVREDVLDALSRELQPDERFDRGLVRDTLDAVVRAPGRIINTVTLGQALQLDRRTVDRHLAVLERRFLLQRLPNLALSPTTQAGARAKAHAFDVAVAAESLRRAGVDLSTDRERFGQVLESWVVQQLTSAASWSRARVDAFFWRRSRPFSEVDLVLIDDRGRTVGVEVKAAREVRASDADGLRALRAAKGLHRGVVVYLGDDVVALGEDLWALPVSALDSTEGFVMPATESRVPPSDGEAHEAYDASLFLSYAHADDDYLGGAMLAFADALQESYSFLFGGTIRVFTDRGDLAWGRAWQQQLDAAIEDTQFLLAMVTPRYLQSEACRREFEQFLSATGSARHDLVLSLKWTTLPAPNGSDPVRAHVDAHQWKTAGDLAALEPRTPAYRAAVEQLAAALHERITRREHVGDARVPVPDESDEGDLVEAMAAFDRFRPELEGGVDRFGSAMSEFGVVFEASRFDPKPAAMARLEQLLAGPVDRLSSATTELARVWGVLDAAFSEVAAIAPYVAQGDERAELAQTILELRVTLDVPELLDAERLVGVMGRISRHLRPASRALAEAIRVIRTMQRSAEDWRAALG